MILCHLQPFLSKMNYAGLCGRDLLYSFWRPKRMSIIRPERHRQTLLRAAGKILRDGHVRFYGAHMLDQTGHSQTFYCITIWGHNIQVRNIGKYDLINQADNTLRGRR